MAVQLAPYPGRISLWPHDLFLAKQSETLILREKVMSLSGDSFEIKLQNGTPVLTVKGKVLSISGRKSVYDMAGNHLFDIQKELLHIHATFAAVDPQGKKLLEVKSSFALLGSKATATFTNAMTGAQEQLQMKGNWFDSAANIVDLKTGQAVGQINRKLLSGRDLLFGQQTYALTVAPGVDLALMVAMCICMDEKNNDKGGGFIF